MAKLAIVLPTNRPERLLQWERAWRPIIQDATLYVVHDADAVPVACADIGHALSRRAIPRPNIFSIESDAIRCLGVLHAYHAGHEWVLTTDDDVLPVMRETPDNSIRTSEAVPPTFIHETVFRPAWRSVLDGTRGVPIHHRGAEYPVGATTFLPQGDADQSAIYRIVRGSTENPNTTGVLYPGEYFALSSLCMVVRRDLVPLWYFPPQSGTVGFDRWGDIWAGLVLCRVASHLGYAIEYRSGQVRHDCQSGPFTALAKEHGGLSLNETLWERLDRLILTGSTVIACAREIVEWLATQPEPYLHTVWSQGFSGWLDLIEDI